MSYKRYWWALAIVIIGSFAVLGGVGRKMISEAPPLPDVYTTDGQLLFTGSSITDGQGVWQSIGGQEIGSLGSRRLRRTRLERGLAAPGIGDSAQHLGRPGRCNKLCRSQSGSTGYIQGSSDS